MAELLLDTIVAGFALCGLTAALLIQCGDKRKAPKKNTVKSSKGSVKSAKSVKARSKKSSRSKKGPVSVSKESTRSSKLSKSQSVESSKAPKQQSSRKSARSSKRSEEVGIAGVAKAPKQQSSRKSARSSKRSDKEVAIAGVANAKAHTSTARVKTPHETIEESICDDLSLRSLQETQRGTVSQTDMHTALELVNNNGPLKLHIEPRELRFSDQGGLLKVRLHNPTNTRQAIKVKCSDNAIYRVNPVYGYVEPGQQLNLEVIRQSGKSSKVDKLVFVTTKAPAENTDVKKLFKSGTKADMPLMTLPLLA